MDTCGGSEYEIIVVDNASSDGSADAVREAFRQVYVIANKENAGYARANNQGYEISKGDFILLLNPDTVAMPGAIKNVLEFMRNTSDAGMAGCKLLNPDGSLQKSIRTFPTIAENLLRALFLDKIVYSNYQTKTYGRDKPIKIDYATGAFLMVRRDALGGLSLLNPEFFMYAEEKDLGMRLRESGWETYFVPTAEVVHYGGQSTGQIAVEMFLELQKSQVKFFVLHYRPIKAFSLAASWGLVLLMNLVISLPLILFRGGGRFRLFARAVMSYPLMLKEFFWKNI